MDGSGWVSLRPDGSFVPQLLAASRDRRGLDCAGADVDAADLRAACLAVGEADPFGLRLAGATVTGGLDLRTCAVPVPLRFESCAFTDPVNVQGAELHELVISGDPAASRPATLPGLVAIGVRIDRDLVLSGMVFTGDVATGDARGRSASIWLTEADIGGSVVAAGTRILPATGRALHAERVRVAGNLRLTRGFHATGELRLLAMRLGGSLDVMDARFTPADGRALDLAEATIGGSVFLLDSVRTGGAAASRAGSS
ncbi:hypothetical protein [Actinoplanes sp. CA-252034]|uniref:hypothetical protein n=1 Tax=Actinoplanes sp. CA-252034 TaxID=3239906 RepID=UPI003D982537